MPDNTRRRKQIDEQIERAVKGDPKPDKPAAPSAMERAEAKFKRGRQRASDSRVYGNLELARKAARDLLEGTMEMNRLKRNQSTDSNN
jgi:hypothetical protein